MFDYHVHTVHSADCETPIEASCAAAILAGVTEIAFTDHVDHERGHYAYGYYDYAAFMESIKRAREVYGGQLAILAGAEVDFNTRIADDVERFLEQHEFDFVIGSVHFGDEGVLIFPEYFEARSLDDVFLPYYEQLHTAAETGWFDTLGHIDLPKRYAPATAGEYDPLRYEDQLRSLFRTMIDRGLSFEINTSGLRQGPKTSMPAGQIVGLYASMGGELITTGSDSHVADTIGAGLQLTYDMLQLCGFSHVSSFRQRQRTQVPIASLLASTAIARS